MSHIAALMDLHQAWLVAANQSFDLAMDQIIEYANHEGEHWLDEFDETYEAEQWAAGASSHHFVKDREALAAQIRDEMLAQLQQPEYAEVYSLEGFAAKSTMNLVSEAREAHVAFYRAQLEVRKCLAQLALSDERLPHVELEVLSQKYTLAQAEEAHAKLAQQSLKGASPLERLDHQLQQAELAFIIAAHQDFKARQRKRVVREFYLPPAQDLVDDATSYMQKLQDQTVKKMDTALGQDHHWVAFLEEYERVAKTAEQHRLRYESACMHLRQAWADSRALIGYDAKLPDLRSLAANHSLVTIKKQWAEANANLKMIEKTYHDQLFPAPKLKGKEERDLQIKLAEAKMHTKALEAIMAAESAFAAEAQQRLYQERYRAIRAPNGAKVLNKLLPLEKRIQLMYRGYLYNFFQPEQHFERAAERQLLKASYSPSAFMIVRQTAESQRRFIENLFTAGSPCDEVAEKDKNLLREALPGLIRDPEYAERCVRVSRRYYDAKEAFTKLDTALLQLDTRIARCQATIIVAQREKQEKLSLEAQSNLKILQAKKDYLGSTRKRIWEYVQLGNKSRLDDAPEDQATKTEANKQIREQGSGLFSGLMDLFKAAVRKTATQSGTVSLRESIMADLKKKAEKAHSTEPFFALQAGRTSSPRMVDEVSLTEA